MIVCAYHYEFSLLNATIAAATAGGDDLQLYLLSGVGGAGGPYPPPPNFAEVRAWPPNS